jgi:hypothetical protein
MKKKTSTEKVPMVNLRFREDVIFDEFTKYSFGSELRPAIGFRPGMKKEESTLRLPLEPGAIAPLPSLKLKQLLGLTLSRKEFETIITDLQYSIVLGLNHAVVNFCAEKRNVVQLRFIDTKNITFKRFVMLPWPVK